MKKVVWVLVGLVFLTFFMLWRHQQGEGSCLQCFSMVFPEESQDVETSFVDEVNKEACLINLK
ncbi:MAG: hypothetical protein ACHQVS_03725 [Candidatus Babeliales bacterium]